MGETASEFSHLLTSHCVKPSFGLGLNLPSHDRPSELPERGNDIDPAVLRISGHHYVIVAGGLESPLHDEFEISWMQGEQVASYLLDQEFAC